METIIHDIPVKELARLRPVLTTLREWLRENKQFYLSGKLDIAEDYHVTLFSVDYNASIADIVNAAKEYKDEDAKQN